MFGLFKRPADPTLVRSILGMFDNQAMAGTLMTGHEMAEMLNRHDMCGRKHRRALRAAMAERSAPAHPGAARSFSGPISVDAGLIAAHNMFGTNVREEGRDAYRFNDGSRLTRRWGRWVGHSPAV